MKKILLVMHNYAGIVELIKQNLNKIGYKDVDFIIYNDEQFKYKKFSHKIKNLYKKTILGDKTFKEKLKKDFIEETLIKKAENLTHYDDIIVLNTDMFTDDFLITLKRKTNRLIGNHWDGLTRTPEIYNKLKYFDKFFVFDKDDANEEKKIFFLTNFYFNIYQKGEVPDTILQDVYYLGTYVEKRFNKLKKISETISRLGFTQKIMLFEWQKKEADGNILFTNNFVSFSQNIKNVKESKVLIDLKLEEHNGLSFRFFEALQFEKKIITDNASVISYDFYKPENIFVLGKDSYEKLENFIKKPYQKVPKEIKEKYSFETWFRTLIS